MSIRIAALWIFVIALAIYAWRDWFIALCGLILLMAVVEHPDMPKSVLGIQGLNPWNILFAVVVCAWAATRRREGLNWDLPGGTALLLVSYLLMVLLGFFRMMGDRRDMEWFTTGYLVSETLVNTIKWVIPGLLLFDGCRTRRRFHLGLASMLAVYVLLAVQIIRWMPPSAVLSAGELTARSRKILLNEVGFHAVNLSMLLAGASWALLATLPLFRRPAHRFGIVLAALAILYGQALTAGRMGYATWAVVGLILCLIKWRKMLIVVPLIPLTALAFLPGVVDRMMLGFGEAHVSGVEVTDDYLVTSGGTLIWPMVIEEIGRSPALGHGRKAMIRTGLVRHIREGYGENFPHPHNAYLEWLLDNGIVGFMLVMPFYVLVIWRSGSLFLDRSHPVFGVIGGVAWWLVLALLVAGMGSQTFYPREGAVGMWCGIGLMMRVWVERRKAALATAQSAGGGNPQLSPVSAYPAADGLTMVRSVSGGTGAVQ